MSLFATKSIERILSDASAGGRHSLKPVLGPWSLIALGIGAVIGAGIFVLTGQAAGAHAGPAVVLSMLLAGVASALAGRAAPGTLIQTAAGPVTSVFNVPALVVALLVTALLVVGVRESATMNALMVVMKVSVVLMVIAVGALCVNTANWHPFLPRNTGVFGEYGWSGVFRGAAVIFFAYIGFDAVSTAAQEARNPRRDMPLGILVSLGVCTLLYMAVSGVLVGLVPYTKLRNEAAPIVAAITSAGRAARGTPLAGVLSVLRVFVEIGALAGITSVMLVTLLGQSRIFFAMSNDGLVPEWARRIHPRFRTPHVSTLVVGLAVALTAGFTPIEVLSQLVSIGTLAAFVIVAAGILFLRRSRPDLPRPFRTPWVPFVPPRERPVPSSSWESGCWSASSWGRSP